MEFRVLGPLEVLDQGGVVDLGPPRTRLICGILLARPGRLVPVAQFVDELWPEGPPPDARALVRGYVSRLRRALRSGPSGADRVVTRKPGYLLRLDDQELDLHRFEGIVALARTALRTGETALGAELLRDALSLWRGEPFADVERTASIAAAADRLTEQRLSATEDWFTSASAAGQDADVLGELAEFVAAHPRREGPAGQYMLALYRAGRVPEALAQYRRTRQALADEVGVDPSAELQRLHQRILTGDPSLDRDGEAPVAAWRQLPMDIAEFTGRQRELAELRALVDAGATDTSTAVVVSAIEGMAGVGKTRLAVHLAHRLANQRRYDVQLWTDLQGFDEEHPPADPADVLENFLRLLGVPGDRVPADVESRAAMYRDRLAGRRGLILLDNAANEEQVRPLLPGRPGFVVLITSRRGLPGLAGAHTLSLDVLPPPDAVELMARIVTDGRIEAQPDAAARVAKLCGHLPIALSMAARRLRARPQWTVEDLAERLARAVPSGVTGTFALSYRAIPTDQQRMFRLLGVHVGTDVTVGSAAALAGVPAEEAEDLLEALLDEHLLNQEVAGRYRCHDLIVPYARQLAETEEQDEAVHRQLTWYLHTAEAARLVLDPHRIRIIDLHPLAPGCAVPEFRDYEQAMTWYEAERGNLVAAVRAARPRGLAEVAWQLAWVMMSFFYRRSYWDDWISTFRTALAATQAQGERRAEGIMWRGLGVAYSDLRRFDEAIDCYRRAQLLFEEVGDRHAQGWNLNNIGVAHVDLNDLQAAEDCFRRGLELLRQTGDRQGEGFCLNNLGDTTRRLGNPEEAITHLTAALDLQHQRDDQTGLQFTLTTLGDVHRDTEQYDAALDYYAQALATSRRLDDQRTAARTLTHLAKTHQRLGNHEAATSHWQEAHRIFTELGDPQAEETASGPRP